MTEPLPVSPWPLLRAVLAAGEAILSVYHAPFEVTLKADQSPLTEADRASNDILTAYLKAAAPFPVLSEEGKTIPYSERSLWSDFWLVDPLDGTKEFIKKNGEFTVNVALIRNGRPVFGVIYVPVTGECYLGLAGTGAFRIDALADPLKTNPQETEFLMTLPMLATRLPVSVSLMAERPLVVVGSRSHKSPEMTDFVEKMKERHPDVQCIDAGSSLKLCRVAEGSADVYPRFGPTMEWDTAAGHAIVSAAGGAVRRMDTGAPLSYNKENLANPPFIAALDDAMVS